MKKTICLLLILMLVFSLACLAACDKPVPPPVDLGENEKENTTMEKPEGKTPDQLSAKESLYVAVGELERSGGFTASAVGSTTSLMGITQSIAADRTVVGDNVFKQSSSFSTFVKSGEQLYVYGENYLLRKAKSVSGLDNVTWENTATKYSKEAWDQLIGYRPNGLTGYVLNDNTILDAFLVSAENGLYTFRYVLDTQKAPHYLLYEMRHNANSDKFPYFTKAEIVVTMDKNFIVKTLSTDCEYRASSAGLSDLPCKENLTETFNVGYMGDLPQKEFFEQFFDASSVDQVEEKKETALDVLTSMLDEYLTKGKTLNAELTVSQHKKEYINALVALNIDLNNLEALTLDAKVGKNLYLNYANNRLLVDFQAFKGSTTIDGVLQYVSSLFTDPFGGAIDFSIDTDALLSQMTYEIKNDVARVSLPFNIANLHVEANLYGTVVEKGVYKFRNAVLGIGNLIVRLVPTESWEVPSFEGEYPEILSLTKLLQNGKIALKTEVMDIAASIMLDVAGQQVFVNTDYFDCTLSNNTLYAKVGDAKVKFDLNAADTILGLLSDFVEIDLPMPQAETVSEQSILDVISNLTATKQGENTVLTINVDGLTADIVLVEQTDGWWVDSVKVNVGEQQLVLTPSEQFEVLPIGNAADYADVTQAAIDFIPQLNELKSAESYNIDLDTVWQFGEERFGLYGDAVVQPYGESLALDLNFEILHNNEQIVVGNAVLVNNYVYLTINDVKVAISVQDLGNGSDSGELQNLLSALPIEINNKALKSVADKIQSIVERVQQGLGIGDIIGLLNNISYYDYHLTVGLDGQLFDVNDFDLVATVLSKGIALSFDDLLLGDASVYAVAMLRATDEQVVMDCPEEYTTDITEVIASLNLELAIDGSVMLGSELYDLSACAVSNDNGNMQISALMSYDGVRVLDVTAYIYNNKLYVELDGVRFVTDLPESGLQGDTTALEEIVSALRGKNEYLDKLLNYVEEIKGKAQNGQLSTDKLLKKVVIDEESISVVLDGTELNISEMNLVLAENGITLCANGFAYEDICADVKVNANFSDKVVAEPTGDWNTYLAVKIDEHNTLFANLDLLNGIFVFKLENDLPETSEDGTTTEKEPLYIEYTVADNFVRLKKGDVKICGDIQEIADLVEYIDGLVKDFAGQNKGDSGSSLGDLAGLSNIDLSQLLQELSVQLTVDKASDNATLKLSALNISAAVYITNRQGTTIDYVDVSLGNSTYRVTPGEAFELPDFGSRDEYVNLNEVFNDYLSTIEALVHTHSWTFDFNGDSQIDVKDQQGNTTSYQIAAGSYVKFYFNLAEPQDFMLRANIVLKQLKNGVWEDFITVDAAIINGRIYVTYNETLKFSISLEAIASCADLVDELRQTIPQLDELLDNLANAKGDAEQIVNNLDYSAIIKGISYDKERSAFGIVLNGKLLSEKLGDITIYTSRTENTMTLEQLSLTYDNVSLNLNGITVSASELTQLAEGETVEHDYENYVVAQEVLHYIDERGDESAHINFDSLRQLLRALIDTANNDTFAIDGTVNATLDLGLYKPEIVLKLHLRIDLDEEGNVYIAAQIVRENTKLLLQPLFDDEGGNSYLHYNGKTGEFTVIRDSYRKVQVTEIVQETYDFCTNNKCNKEATLTCKMFHKKYIETRTKDVEKKVTRTLLQQNDYRAVLSTQDFVATMEDQIFEMLNFGKIFGIDIEKFIRDSMSGEKNGGLSTNDTLAQLQNIFLNYEYVMNVGTDSLFKLQADLSPLDKNFGKLNLNVGHTYLFDTVTDEQGNTTTNEKLELTSLTGDFTIATIMKLNWDLTLQQQPTYGQGIDFVTNETHWIAE